MEKNDLEMDKSIPISNRWRFARKEIDISVNILNTAQYLIFWCYGRIRLDSRSFPIAVNWIFTKYFVNKYRCRRLRKATEKFIIHVRSKSVIGFWIFLLSFWNEKFSFVLKFVMFFVHCVINIYDLGEQQSK